MKDNRMYDIGLKFGNDKVTYHRYDLMYPKYIDKYQDRAINVLEIGLGDQKNGTGKSNLFGVAYGVDDLPWAENTIHLVKKYLEEMENIDNKNFQKFIKFWEKKLQINNND